MNKLCRVILVTILLAAPCHGLASDLAKEKRWAEQVVDAIFDGEPVTLKDGELDFLAIYTPSAISNSTDAVILLHGLGVHPDWDQVIRPLRTGLPEHGWSTLSLQMPILANGIGYEEYAPLFIEVPGRIESGIKYLKKQGAKRIVIISHSLGASMAAYYLANNQPEIIAGFVAIGMGGASSYPEMNNIQSLKLIRVPVFDLFGENDLAGVLASAKDKKLAVESRKYPAVNNTSSQKMMGGTDHFFNGQNEALINEVSSWLKGLQ
jgi:pimeloyl-ACP methyl ester carboxylesterase